VEIGNGVNAGIIVGTGDFEDVSTFITIGNNVEITNTFNVLVVGDDTTINNPPAGGIYANGFTSQGSNDLVIQGGNLYLNQVAGAGGNLILGTSGPESEIKERKKLTKTPPPNTLSFSSSIILGNNDLDSICGNNIFVLGDNNQVNGMKNFVFGDSNTVTDSNNGIFASTKSTICTAKGSAIVGGMKNAIYSDNSVIVGGSSNLIGQGSQCSVIDGSDSVQVGAAGISVFGGEDETVCSNSNLHSSNQTLIKKKTCKVTTPASCAACKKNKKTRY